MRLRVTASTLVLALLAMGVPCAAFMPAMDEPAHCEMAGAMADRLDADPLPACCLEAAEAPRPDRVRDGVRPVSLAGPDFSQNLVAAPSVGHESHPARAPLPPGAVPRHVLFSVFLI